MVILCDQLGLIEATQSSGSLNQQFYGCLGVDVQHEWKKPSHIYNTMCRYDSKLNIHREYKVGINL